jgi:hypothetical protein
MLQPQKEKEDQKKLKKKNSRTMIDRQVKNISLQISGCYPLTEKWKLG